MRRRIADRLAIKPIARSTLAAEVAAYNEALAEHGRAEEEAGAVYERELERTRAALYEIISDEEFRYVLLLSTPGLLELTPRGGTPPPRNKSARRREAAWTGYVQRLATKADTISRFGPSTWGVIDPALDEPVRISLDEPPIADSVRYLERWPCVALAERIEQDPEARSLVPVVVHDDVRLEEGRAVRLSTGQAAVLSPAAQAVAAKLVAGETPPRDEEALAAAIDELVAKDVACRKIELPVDPDPFAFLERAVAAWPEGAAKQRWTACLSGIREAVSTCGRASDNDALAAAIAALERRLTEAGVGERDTKGLYAARLPINEDCRRAVSEAAIGPPLVEQITGDLAPWYELWRDLAGLYATRILGRLTEVWREVSDGEPVPLPAFFAAADRARVPLARAGAVGYPPELAGEIQRAWQEQLGERWREREVALDDDDLSFVRRRFELKRMKAYDQPAPDVIVMARDADAVRAGEWQLLLGEIHPDFTPWVGYDSILWCPDPGGFSAAFKHPGHPPALEFATPMYETIHTLTCAPARVPGFTCTGPVRIPGCRSVRSADIAVHLEGDDIVARDADGRFLGSLVHTWSVASSTHRLELLGEAAHTPRLRVGRVIVQRESWLVERDPALRARLERRGVPPLVALRELRRKRAMPEELFARAILPMRGTWHKAGKPIMVDFSSPLLLENLAALMRRYRQVRLSEMLPGTGDYWLADSRGRYAHELRFVTTPPVG